MRHLVYRSKKWQEIKEMNKKRREKLKISMKKWKSPKNLTTNTEHRILLWHTEYKYDMRKKSAVQMLLPLFLCSVIFFCSAMACYYIEEYICEDVQVQKNSQQKFSRYHQPCGKREQEREKKTFLICCLYSSHTYILFHENFQFRKQKRTVKRLLAVENCRLCCCGQWNVFSNRNCILQEYCICNKLWAR